MRINHIFYPRNFLTLLLLVFLSACFTTKSDVNKIVLFNGYDLDNWRQAGSATWLVRDEEIILADKNGEGMLVSKKKYSNFRLQLEFWVDDKVNSGIFIRCDESGKFTPFNCYEMNIWDKHPKQEFRTGSIVTLVSPPLAQVTTINKWNTYEIVADGENLIVKVNGILTARLEDEKHSNGYIALQRANDGMVRFRNIVLELL